MVFYSETYLDITSAAWDNGGNDSLNICYWKSTINMALAFQPLLQLIFSSLAFCKFHFEKKKILKSHFNKLILKYTSR